MELLIPHECHYCGLVDEAKFVYAGPHIKQVCNGCNRYVKFFSKYQIPDIKEIKLKIWSMTTDVVFIDKLKSEIGFTSSSTADVLDKKIMYWRLYLKVKANFNLKEVKNG